MEETSFEAIRCRPREDLFRLVQISKALVDSALQPMHRELNLWIAESPIEPPAVSQHPQGFHGPAGVVQAPRQIMTQTQLELGLLNGIYIAACLFQNRDGHLGIMVADRQGLTDHRAAYHGIVRCEPVEVDGLF